MSRLIVALVLLVLALPVQSRQGDVDAVKKELEKFQGRWIDALGAITHDGGNQKVLMPADPQVRVEIKGNEYRFRHDEKQPWLWTAKITLDLSATPPVITLTKTIKEGGKEIVTVEKGIYRWTDNGVEIQDPLPGKPLPKAFLELNKPKKEVEGTLRYLQRAK
jgi:uncharacterized protein (TIGR03067 family)